VAVGNALEWTAEDIDAVLGDGWTHLRWESAAGSAGPFSTLVDVLLDEDEATYTYTDPVGVFTNWYRHRFYNSVDASLSEPSAPYPAAGAPTYSGIQLVCRIAREVGMLEVSPSNLSPYPEKSGTTTETGTTSTLVSSPYADSLLEDDQYRGWWLRFLDGALSSSATDAQVRVAAFAKASGTFTFARTLAAAPGNAVDFTLTQEPLEKFLEAIWETMADIWIDFNIPISPDTVEQRQFDVPYWLTEANQIRRIMYNWRQASWEETYLVSGVDFEVVTRPGGGKALSFPEALPLNDIQYLMGVRPLVPEDLLSLDTTIVLSQSNLRLLVVGAAGQLIRNLRLTTRGTKADREEFQKLYDETERERQALVRESPGFNTGIRISSRMMTTI